MTCRKALLLMIAVFALSASACADIIFPPHPDFFEDEQLAYEMGYGEGGESLYEWEEQDRTFFYFVNDPNGKVHKKVETDDDGNETTKFIAPPPLPKKLEQVKSGECLIVMTENAMINGKNLGSFRVWRPLHWLVKFETTDDMKAVIKDQAKSLDGFRPFLKDENGNIGFLTGEIDIRLVEDFNEADLKDYFRYTSLEYTKDSGKMRSRTVRLSSLGASNGRICLTSRSLFSNENIEWSTPRLHIIRAEKDEAKPE